MMVTDTSTRAYNPLPKGIHGSGSLVPGVANLFAVRVVDAEGENAQPFPLGTQIKAKRACSYE
jgi:hypothetical protein